MRLSTFREEWPLGVGIATSVAFLLMGGELLEQLSRPPWVMVEFAWLFFVILSCAIAVVRHADHLAEHLGEPYGTLILTLSATAIEAVSISAVMVHAEEPTLVRDMLFAVIMFIMNGLVGVSLLLGGWKHREQTYNLQGANAYLGVIIPLAMMSLILPAFTQTTPGPTLSPTQESVLALMSIGLYGAFLFIQTGRHRGFFVVERQGRDSPPPSAHDSGRSSWFHGALLTVYLIPVVYLAEQLATPMEHLIGTLHAPLAIGGVLIAILVLTPEALGAFRAALADQQQRAVNILLGSVLCTIGLTIPTMLVISHYTGRQLVLGVEHANYVMLLLTLVLSVVTFGSGRTNVLQGFVHCLLFVAYVLLIFQS